MLLKRGTLITSGFIAGGVLMDVVSADWYVSWSSAEWIAVVMYVVIVGYFIWDAKRVRKD